MLHDTPTIQPQGRVIPISEKGQIEPKKYGKSATLSKRFWQKVKIGNSSECWPWLASTRANGYGQMWDGQFPEKSHRIAWFLKFGEIPAGKCVCHKCDNRRCCNPDHLFIGSRGENNSDMWKKGRGRTAFGESHTKAKLTEQNVHEIRRLKIEGWSYEKLSKRFVVTEANIYAIVKNKSWKHLK